MIMIWLLAEKTRSQRAKTMMPGEALRGVNAVASSWTLSGEHRRRPLSGALHYDLKQVDVRRGVRDETDHSVQDGGRPPCRALDNDLEDVHVGWGVRDLSGFPLIRFIGFPVWTPHPLSGP